MTKTTRCGGVGRTYYGSRVLTNFLNTKFHALTDKPKLGEWVKNKVILQQLPSNNWRDNRLLEPLAYRTHRKQIIFVPPGTVTDQASVPRALWSKFPPNGRWSASCILHDYLCVRHGTNNPHPYAQTRADVDRIFWESLLTAGVNRVDAFLLWAGVRIATNLMGWSRRGYLENYYADKAAKMTRSWGDVNHWMNYLEGVASKEGLDNHGQEDRTRVP